MAAGGAEQTTLAGEDDSQDDRGGGNGSLEDKSGVEDSVTGRPSIGAYGTASPPPPSREPFDQEEWAFYDSLTAEQRNVFLLSKLIDSKRTNDVLQRFTRACTTPVAQAPTGATVVRTAQLPKITTDHGLVEVLQSARTFSADATMGALKWIACLEADVLEEYCKHSGLTAEKLQEMSNDKLLDVAVRYYIKDLGSVNEFALADPLQFASFPELRKALTPDGNKWKKVSAACVLLGIPKKDVMEAYIRHLNENRIRQLVRNGSPTTVEEAIKVAEKVAEMMQNLGSVLMPPSHRAAPVKEQSQPAPKSQQQHPKGGGGGRGGGSGGGGRGGGNAGGGQQDSRKRAHGGNPGTSAKAARGEGCTFSGCVERNRTASHTLETCYFAHPELRPKRDAKEPENKGKNRKYTKCIGVVDNPFNPSDEQEECDLAIHKVCAVTDMSPRAMAVTLSTGKGIVNLTTVLDTQSSHNIIDISVAQRLKKKGAVFTRIPDYNHQFLLMANGVSRLLITETTTIDVVVNRIGSENIIIRNVKLVVAPSLITEMILGEQVCKDATLVKYQDGLPWITQITEGEVVVIDPDEMLSNECVAQPIVNKEYSLFDKASEMIRHYQSILAKQKGILLACKAPPVVFPIDHTKKAFTTRNRVWSAPKLACLVSTLKKLEDALIIFEMTESVAAAAQVVMIAKKLDASAVQEWRLAIDFTPTMNRITEHLQPVIPNAEEIIKKATGWKVYGQCDFANAYYQMELHPDMKKYTAFVANGKTYAFHRLPQGYSESPAIYNRWTDQCFNKVLNADRQGRGVVLKYFDNVYICANDDEYLLEMFQEVLDVCTEYNITISGAKTEVGMKEINVLGHLTSEKGCRIDPERVEALTRIGTPQNPKQLRSLLGTFNYVSQFIKNFSDIAAPLTSLTGITDLKKWRWGEVEAQALAKLKKAAAEAPHLHNLDPTLPIHMNTDASKSAVGAVLFQQPVGEGPRAIAFTSRKLAAQQGRWPNWERELFAVYHAMMTWNHYISGLHVIVHSDCTGIHNIHFDKVSDKVARWLSYIQSQSHSLLYIRGEDNEAADCLSRQVEEESQLSLSGKAKPAVHEFTPSGKAGCQSSDHLNTADSMKTQHTKGSEDAHDRKVVRVAPAAPSCVGMVAVIATRIQSGSTLKLPVKFREPMEDESVSHTQSKPKKRPADAELPNPVVSKHTAVAEMTGARPGIEPEESETLPILLSPADTATALKMPLDRVEHLFWAHGSSLHGHWGTQKMITILQHADKTWSGMAKDIECFITSCPLCQKHKVKPKSVGPIKDLAAFVPNESWSIDFVYIRSNGKADPNGNRYWLAVIDDFSRFAWSLPVQDITTDEAIRVLSELFASVRTPRQIRSDQGSQFTAHKWPVFLNQNQIKGHVTTARRHEANGLVERVIQTIQNEMRMRLCEMADRTRWVDALRMAVSVYNNCPHSTTRFSPRELMYPDPQITLMKLGEMQSMRALQQMDGAQGRNPASAEDDRVEVHVKSIETANVHQKQALEQRRAKGEGRKLTSFKIGQLVLARYEHEPSKLAPRYKGVFRITAVHVSNNTYTICDVRNIGGDKVVHLQDLIPFNPTRTANVSLLASLDDEKWVVEKVLDHNTAEVSGKLTTDLLVQWEGFIVPQWTHIGDITPENCSALREYLRQSSLSYDKGSVAKRSRP